MTVRFTGVSAPAWDLEEPRVPILREGHPTD